MFYFSDRVLFSEKSLLEKELEMLQNWQLGTHLQTAGM